MSIVCAASSFGDRCLVETSPPIEASTVFCNEQSNGSDVGFCALQALYYGIIDTFPNGAGNKHVRRLNIQSSTSLTFEVESFDRRFDNVPAGNPHFWFCYRDTPVNRRRRPGSTPPPAWPVPRPDSPSELALSYLATPSAVCYNYRAADAKTPRGGVLRPRCTCAHPRPITAAGDALARIRCLSSSQTTHL